MRIGILSDTHGYLDEAIFQYFAECDEVWHAGDIGSIEIVDRLTAFRPLRAVYGNIDDAVLRRELPREQCWTVEGVAVLMTHIGNDARAKREIQLRRPGLFVCGHSHILAVRRDPQLGHLYVNPGACGRHGFHIVRTLLRLTIEGGKMSGAEAIELGPRVNPKKAGPRPE